MRKYDLTLILSSQLDKEALDKVQDKVRKFVADTGGKVEKIDEWGKRQLSYPIKKQKQGTYFNLTLELDEKGVRIFEDKLKIEDMILRHLLVKRND